MQLVRKCSCRSIERPRSTSLHLWRDELSSIMLIQHLNSGLPLITDHIALEYLTATQLFLSLIVSLTIIASHLFSFSTQTGADLHWDPPSRDIYRYVPMPNHSLHHRQHCASAFALNMQRSIGNPLRSWRMLMSRVYAHNLLVGTQSFRFIPNLKTMKPRSKKRLAESPASRTGRPPTVRNARASRGRRRGSRRKRTQRIQRRVVHLLPRVAVKAPANRRCQILSTDSVGSLLSKDSANGARRHFRLVPETSGERRAAAVIMRVRE